jgi:hypothetical protein
MSFCPGVHIFTVGWIRIDPGLGDSIVQVCPLSDDVGFALEFVFLEPSLDVGSNQLPGFRPALIFDNWSKRRGNPVT